MGLTPRENFIHYLHGQPYEWIPTGSDRKSFLPSLISENIARGRIAQQNPFDPSKYGGIGWFNVDWVYGTNIGGSMERKPLYSDPEDLLNWKENLEFPDLDALDWEGCAKENAEYLRTDRLLDSTVYSTFFERLISLVGFEDAAIALIDEEMEDTVRELFDALADFYIDYMKRMHHYFNVELFIIHDDWGSQRGPLISEGTQSAMILPYIQKVVDGAHQDNILVEQHCCGKIEPLVPNIIRSGIDTWVGQNINDKYDLVCRYGDQFTFGVEVSVTDDVDDDTCVKSIRNTVAMYAGKKVWYKLPKRGLAPERAKLFDKVLREALDQTPVK